MRSGLKDALGRNPTLASAHAGLLYERYAEPLYENPPGGDKDKLGKVEAEALKVLIGRVADIGIPRVYRRALQRWRRALSATGALTHEVEASARLLIGHGNPAPGEVGLTLHPVYGTPLIPGSALKGLANHYLADWGAATDEAAWHGVRYDKKGRPVGAPGTAHGILFGAPSLHRGDGGDLLGHRGGVIFEDAWLIPTGDKPLIEDVLTPHQKGYYRDSEAEPRDWPNDWTDPTPVSFLSVRPRTRFLIAVTALDGGRKAAELALNHLLDALEQWGIGGKTTAGYGRLRRCDPTPVQPDDAPQTRQPRSREASPPSSPTLQALAQAVDAVLSPSGDNPPPLVQRFDNQDWDALLGALGAGEASGGRALLAKLNEHRGLHKRRGEQVATLIERVKP